VSDVLPFPQQEPAPRRPGLIVAGVLGVLVLLVAMAAAANWMLPIRAEVAPRTTVGGIDVGGLSRPEVREVISGPLTEKVAATITLTAGDGRIEVDPDEAGLTLDAQATERALLATGPDTLLGRWRQSRDDTRRDLDPVLTVDEEKATTYLAERLAPLDREAKDATLTAPAPRPVMTTQGTASWSPRPADVEVGDARTGQEVDPAGALIAVREAVNDLRTQAEVEVRVTQPTLGSDEARKVDQLIGTFTTTHPCCQPRVTNIQRMAEIVDGTVLMPGDEFSLNRTTGRRTTESGFVPAPALVEGESEDQVGGGVSQFSTTLYNATWFAGIDLITHAPHSQYFSRYPPGREATLDYDSIDQKFRNDTDAPILIRTATTGTTVTVALYGHTGDREVVSTTGPRRPTSDGGFSIVVTRVVRDSGSNVSTKEARATYRGPG
jgi:vancomycin resistance protein YoaR